MEIGDRIKKLRLEKGLTGPELAAVTGTSRSSVYRYENGNVKSIPAKVLHDLAGALGTTPAYLAGWTEDPSPGQNGEDLPAHKVCRKVCENWSENPIGVDDQGGRGWCRFSLHFKAGPERDELYQLLDRLQLTRRELALIVLGLRARPEFSLADFDT